MPKSIDSTITTRSLSLRLLAGGSPASLDTENRSVEVVCSTESPVDVYDWQRGEILPEILLMSGCLLPENRQVPLLDTHYRGDISSVLGSCRDLRIVNDQLIGRAHYASDDAAAEAAWNKTRQGHLTDYSIGYRVLEATYIPQGQEKNINGRNYPGPVKVATRWKVRELSTCPIGADEHAKARAAATQPLINPHTEDSTMPKQNTDQGRGDQQTTTPQAPAADTNQARSLTEADVKRLADEQTRAEVTRREEIRSMCQHFGLVDMERELIDGNKTLDEARAVVLKKQMEKQPETPQFRAAEITADARDKFRAAGQDALILRSGLKAPEKLAPGADDLRGFSLVEMGREALRIAGQPFGGDAMSMLGRALTTSDFPILLGNTANLALMQGWTAASETWETWADGSGNVSNFNTHTIARAGEVDDLDEIGENDEYTYGSNGETYEQYQLATYGKLSKITRQALINDNLGSITDSFARRGEAAARKVGDVAYAVLTANSALSDGVALFHNTHGNICAAGPVNETTMADMIKLLGLQKDINGKRRLNIPLQYLLFPKALEGAAEIFFNSTMFAGDNKTATRANPYAGPKYTRVYDARLDDDSSTAWYALGPKGKTVKLFFLNGNRVPYLETKDGWNIDGVEFKTRIDVCAKALDYRGMVKNAGA